MLWFKHRSDARNSLKLRKVRRKFGSDGYAIYWFCLEAIAYDVDKDNLTFELKEDAETIAFELSIQEKRVEEIMLYMIKVGLFESSSNMVTCMKLAESIDKSMTNSPKMRAWLDTQSVMTSSDNVNTCAELEVEKKKREVDKNITCDSRFDEFWNLYGKKIDTKKCKAKFDKLSKANQDKIFDVLPDYIASTPDKQFRKLPMTWLNGECWNDEIQKPLTLTNECGINFNLLVENFNKSMMIWSGVPEVIKITDKQKDMISILERDFAMTDERFGKYFEHIATSDKFKYFVDGINMPAQNLTFFLKEDTIQK